MLGFHVTDGLGASIKATSLCLAQVRADLVGRNELLVLVDDGPAETRLLDDNGGEDEAGPNLDEADVEVGLGSLALGRSSIDVAISRLLLAGLALVDLEHPDPDLAVGHGEAHDVVDKGLDFSARLGHAEDLGEELLDDAQMGFFLKGGVEGEDGPRALEAVADEVELLHGVQVLQVHLDRGAVGRLAHPAVEVLALAGLEEEDIVAVVEFCGWLDAAVVRGGVSVPANSFNW